MKKKQWSKMLCLAASDEQYESIAAALNGKSYMGFRTSKAPVGGSFEVWVESDFDDTAKNKDNMVTFLLCCSLYELGRKK